MVALHAVIEVLAALLLDAAPEPCVHLVEHSIPHAQDSDVFARVRGRESDDLPKRLYDGHAL